MPGFSGDARAHHQRSTREYAAALRRDRLVLKENPPSLAASSIQQIGRSPVSRIARFAGSSGMRSEFGVIRRAQGDSAVERLF
jgi:hypothetical protein